MITQNIGDTLKQSVSEQALNLAKGSLVVDVKGVRSRVRFRPGTSKEREAAGRVAKVNFHYQSLRSVERAG